MVVPKVHAPVVGHGEPRVKYITPVPEKVRIRVRVKPPEPRVDGKFLIACRDGLFHLVITPTSGGGRPVEQGQMEGALRGLPLPDGAEAVWQAELARPSGKPVALLGGQVGATRAVNAEELAGDGTIAQAESGRGNAGA